MVKANRLVIAIVVLGLLAACGAGGAGAGQIGSAEWERAAIWAGGRLEFYQPEGVAVDSQGQIYIADTGNHRVQVLRADGSYVTSWGAEGNGPGQFAGHYSGPSGIAVDSWDSVYVVDSAAGRVQKFTSAGEFIAAWGEPGTGPGQFRADDHFGPQGIAIDAAGNVYVADTSNGRIQKFTSDGAFVAEWPALAPGDEYATPAWLAIGGDRLYVTDRSQGHVQVYGLDGARIAIWPDAGFDHIGGVAVSPGGEVFVADKGRVLAFTPDGALLGAIADPEELSRPQALAIDRDGRLIAADSDQNHVALYAPDGSPLPSAPTAGPLPTARPVAGPAVARSPAALTAENASAIAALATLGKGPIQAVAISGDGRRVAVAASTGVSLYDGATLEPQEVFATARPAQAVAFAPDGQRLAIGLDSGAVLIADLAGGGLRPIDNASAFSFRPALAFSPDGATLASASAETVKLWRVADGALLHTLEGHQNTVSAVEFSADGTTLLSVDPGLYGPERSEPVAARRWNAQSGALIETIQTSAFLLDGSATDIAPGAASLLMTTSEGAVEIWQVDPGGLVQTRELAANGVAAAFASDGSAIAVARADGSTALYDRGGGLLRSLEGGASPAHSLAAAAGGARIVAGGADQIVRLWPDGSGPPREVGGFSAGVTAAALSPDGATLAAGTESGRLVLWDLATQTVLWSVPAHSWRTSSVAFSPDGKTIASGGDFMVEMKNFPSESLRLWSAADGALLHSLDGHAYTLEAIAFSPDGALLASASSDGVVNLWQPGDGAFLKKLTAEESFGSLAFSPDGRELIGATIYDSEQDDIWVWQLATGEFARGIQVREDGLYSALALAPDGATLVSSRDDAISVRRAADGAATSSFVAADKVLSMAVSPDGRLLAVGLYDGVVELWDLATGGRPATLAAHTSYATAVAFTPDSAHLISASRDGSIVVWGIR